MNYDILLFYNYVKVEDPKKLKEEQIALCEKLDLKGRIIVAHEGINATLEGTTENVEKYIEEMIKDKRFADTHFKHSEGNGKAFPKLSVKVRREVVSLSLDGKEDIFPREISGKYISAEELHEWITSKKKFYIIDMRNDYEHKVGHFEGSILAPLQNFRDLPEKIQELEYLKDETVVTVCTGGIRCEKASGFLVKHGFKDVYQLHGGIHTYMEKYPNEHFLGKLYVFDGRVTMGFNLDAPEHVIIGKCELCKKPADVYVDCAHKHCDGHRHFICCEECKDKNGLAFCSDACKQKAYVKNEFFRSI